MRHQDVKDALRKVRRIGFGLFFVSLTLIGCGSGGSGIWHGTFMDCTVEGLTFKTETMSGETDSQGVFSYRQGEKVTFSIGGIVLGTATAKSAMTPVDLVAGAQNETDPTVTNITRLLITLDEDNIIGNGITISPEVREALVGASINFDQDPAVFAQDAEVLEVINTVNLHFNLVGMVERTLCSVEEAQDHLGNTLDELAKNGYDHTSASGGHGGSGSGGGGGGCG
jgi:para-nitrobenzyl esterase